MKDRVYAHAVSGVLFTVRVGQQHVPTQDHAFTIDDACEQLRNWLKSATTMPEHAG